MPQRDAAGAAEIPDLLVGAMPGVFPAPVLEALIARQGAAR